MNLRHDVVERLEHGRRKGSIDLLVSQGATGSQLPDDTVHSDFGDDPCRDV
jgi:hypothetical protein